MRVNEWFGDAELGGDIVQRGSRETTRIEELDRFLEDLLALVSQNFVSHDGILRANGLD